MMAEAIVWASRSAVPLSLAATLLLGPAHAQNVKFDGKFSNRVLTAPNYDVFASDGLRKGNNLFQSFEQFTLVNGETATFFGDANIQTVNLLARVTGGKVSSIDGTIRTDPSTLAGANFFFINPSGILFGPKAVLDVSGSVAFSSADYLKLADGARFVASLDADDSALSTASVSAFGFLNSNPGNLALQNASLSVPASMTLALVGGDINMDGGAIVPAGLRQVAGAAGVQMVSIQSPGELALDITDFHAAPDTKPFSELGAIELRNGAAVEAGEFGRVVTRSRSLRLDGAAIRARPLFDPAQPMTAGGAIDVECESLELKNGSQLLIASQTPGTEGMIAIVAHSVRVEGDGSAIVADGRSAGQGGDIHIETDTLKLRHGAEISTSNEDPGADAGDIHIMAEKLVYLQGRQTQIRTDSAAGGGNITIDSKFVVVNQGAMSANAAGQNGGNLLIVADNISTDPKPAKKRISASAAGGPQFDGEVNIPAPDLDLSTTLDGLPSGLLSADSQLYPQCGIRLPGGVSSFLMMGRGGLPLEPDGFAPSFMAEEPGTVPNESTKGTVK